MDADSYSDDPIHGRRFFANGAVVFTISPFVYVSATPVPTMRLTGGPRDGQVAAALDGPLPFHAYFLPTVPLNEHGEAIAPVPPSRLRELAEVYLHLDCPCEGWRSYVFEHVYVWSRDIGAAAEVAEVHCTPGVSTETPG